MTFANLTIGRICLHEIQKRNEDRRAAPVTYSSELLELGDLGLAAFGSRVHSAFRSEAQCMEMEIARHDAGTAAQLGAAIVAANDADFIMQSRAFADLLNHHQDSRSIPGGLVVVFDGTVGNPATPFFAIMKAEMHEGFMRGENLRATFVQNLFLSPKNKLYKIGFFKANTSPAGAMPDGWTATLYDKELSARNREGAAAYFHGSFLGLVIPENNAHQVRKFFEHTRDFIRESAIDEEGKVDLYNGLYTYLKVDRSPNVQVGTFADTYMTEEIGEAYREHMNRARFPGRAIAKDLSEIKGRLKMRRFRFPSKIVLYGPPEAMSELVTIESIDGEGDATWTQITVRGKLEGQD